LTGIITRPRKCCISSCDRATNPSSSPMSLNPEFITKVKPKDKQQFERSEGRGPVTPPLCATLRYKYCTYFPFYLHQHHCCTLGSFLIFRSHSLTRSLSLSRWHNKGLCVRARSVHRGLVIRPLSGLRREIMKL
jgi:hypothetical protein